MKYIIILLAALFILTSCASTQPCEPVIVNKAVAVSCVNEVPKKPELASITLPDNATLAEQIQAISIDALLLLQYSNEQAAVIEGCR
jgi:PBP1b-binding outer membrane lipoprotein LpoB